MKTESKKLIRESIKSAIENIREARANRSVPCLMGCGWTIAVKGQTTCIEERGGGYSFFGMWNRRSIYWKQETALAGMREIQLKVPFELEVIHHNILRDRHEQVSTDIVKTFFRHRNDI
jgi:hypothetical protein